MKHKIYVIVVYDENAEDVFFFRNKENENKDELKERVKKTLTPGQRIIDIIEYPKKDEDK